MPIQPNKPIIALLMALSFGGCTALDRTQDDALFATKTDKAAGAPVEQPAEEARLDIDWVLRYYRHFSTAPDKALADEYQRIKKALAAKTTARDQWRMALLLSVPGTTFHDAERSASIFKALSGDGLKGGSALNDAAFMMHLLLSELSRIDKKSDELTAKLAESKSANKTMQQQLDALKAIEDSLYERNKMEVTPKP